MVSQATKDKVSQLVSQHPVFVASKTYCPYCSASKNTLEEANANAYVIELDELKDGDDIQAALAELTGQRTVPNIFIGGKHIGGNSDLQGLKSKGILAEKIKAAL